MDDFNVNYLRTDIDNNTTVITSDLSVEEVRKKEQKIISQNLELYSASKGTEQYSVHPTEDTNSNSLTLDYIDKLAIGMNSTLDNVIAANQLIIKYALEDGLMGYAYSCIYSNINTNYTIMYNGVDKDGNKVKDYDKIKSIIENFNKSVKIERFIRDCISNTYLEGNCVSVLRTNDVFPIIDILPLTLAYPSDYKINGDSIIEVNIDNIKSKLTKTYKKTKKNKAVYFENIQKEIESNFSDEIVQAYKNKEKYARLDSNYADCVTINSMGRKFGVSPFFRALRPLIILNNLESADVSDSKARSKKIIYQKLRKELMGKNYDLKGLGEQALAHSSLVQALKTNLCAYTSPAYVESLEFVSSKSNNEDSSTLMKLYTSKFLQSLGISFTDNEVGNYSTVKTSVTQLIRTINCIISDIERVINKYYATIIEENGIDRSLAPTIKIADAEEMEMSIRQELAAFIYGTLNVSRETTFKLLNLDLDDEIEKRKNENSKKLDEVFTPHSTAYNKSSDSDREAGRPETNEDIDKQQNDENYNKDVRK